VREERERGIAAGRRWLDVADAVVFYIDLGLSEGMLDAIEYATQMHKPIEFRMLKGE
jgi:hypothetical protein